MGVTITPMSPLWWVERLSWQLQMRRTGMEKFNRYYTGDHDLPFLTRAHESKMRDEFRMLLEDSRSNFMRLVVDAVEERLRVEGFRLSAASSETADLESWRIWQANEMDAESQTAFLESLVKGVSYLSVWASDSTYASIAVEDPLQTIVEYEPGSNFRRRASALKVWVNDWTGEEHANLYLPNGIYKFRATAPVSGLVGTPQSKALDDPAPRWQELENEFVPNPLGVVPIVPLRNRPRLLLEGESELADVVRVQNQINGFLFLLAIAGYFGAHRQRWAVGLTMNEDKDGKPVEPFNTAIDRLWQTENPDVKFGEFSETSLSGYISAIEQKVQHIAVTTRTPKHYLMPEGQEPSGDAIKSAESGLVKKTERKQRPFGEGLEEALRLARVFQGQPDAPVDSEIVWADPQVRTEAEVTDAAIKKFQAHLIPWSQAVADLGYSQTEIERMLGAFGGVEPSPPAASPPGSPGVPAT